MHKLERWGLAALALGVALRLAAPAFMDLGYDANAYVATAHGWMRTGELVLEWGDVLTFAPSEPGHSHHFPPAYPLYLGLFFIVFGYGVVQAKVAAVVASLAALAVAYACTRDLYGRVPAAAVSGLLALDPHLLWITGMGFSENLALLFFTVTMWAILRSLKEPPFILVAGVFAGLAYLTRSSMGAFFVIAGIGGAAWRLKHRGWRGIASPWYLAGAALFVGIVGLWAMRNFELFGDWQTSPGTRGIPRWIWEHKTWFAVSTVVRTPLLLAVLAPFLVLLWPEAKASLAKWRDEHVSGLWLAVGLTLALGLVFSAAYLSMGTWVDALRLDNMRYVLIALTPLLWALVGERDHGEHGARAGVVAPGPRALSPVHPVVPDRRWLALHVVLLVGCALVFAFPAQYLPAQAAQSLDDALQPGDSIAVAGAGKYPFYAYLEKPEDVDVWAHGFAGPPADFIVTLHPMDEPGYVLLQEKRLRQLPPFGEQYSAVLVREDLARERGLYALEPFRTGW